MQDRERQDQNGMARVPKVSKVTDGIASQRNDQEVTWASLPHKKQLAILTLARFTEPLVATSLQVSRAGATFSPQAS